MKKTYLILLLILLSSCVSYEKKYNISKETEQQYWKEYYNANFKYKYLPYGSFIELRKENYSLENIKNNYKLWINCENKSDYIDSGIGRSCRALTFKDYIDLREYIKGEIKNINSFIKNCNVDYSNVKISSDYKREKTLREPIRKQYFNCADRSIKSIRVKKQAEIKRKKQEEEDKKEKEKIKQEKIKQIEEAKNKKEQLIKEYEQKFGKKFCKEKRQLFMFSSVPSDCLFIIESKGYKMKVSSQISNGTIVDWDTNMEPGFNFTNYFIEKNNTDGNLVDEETIPNGIFIRTGSYNYGYSTYVKLKRLTSDLPKELKYNFIEDLQRSLSWYL